MITEITNETDIELTNNLVVVKFSAPWCGPCKKIAPEVEKLSEQYTNTLFYSVDTDDDDSSEMVDKYNVTALPTFVFLKDNNVQDTVCGADMELVKLNLEKYSS